MNLLENLPTAVQNSRIESATNILNQKRAEAESHQEEDLTYPSDGIGRSLFAISSISSLLPEISKFDMSNATESDNMRNAVSTDTLQFGPMSLEEGLLLIKDEILSEEFYGVLAIDTLTATRMNPLHPIIASELSVNWEKEKLRTYDFYVYSGNWKDSDKSDIEDHKNSIATILLEYQSHQQISYVKSTNIVIDRASRNILDRGSISEALSKYALGEYVFIDTSTALRTEDGNSPYVMVPVQILSDGIAYPYYGTSILQQDPEHDALYGRDCSPMGSANIGRNTTDDRNEVTFYSVCTGGNGIDEHGMSTINQSNLQSPMKTEILLQSWQQYAEASIQLSYEILDPLLTYSPPVVSTKADFATTAEWLQHLSTKHIKT